MSVSVRVHFFDEKGQMKRIGVAQFNQLNSTDVNDYFKAYAGQSVRCALSAVEIENRQAVRINSTDYSIIYFDSEGKKDREESERGKSLAMSAFDILSELDQHTKCPGKENVVDLTPKLSKQTYKRDFTWTPTQGEINAIINDILPSK